AREAAGEQLARANAWRNEQLATTTDPARRQQLLADNEKALQAARQLGVHQQVATASNASALASAQAQQARERERQAEQQATAQRQARENAERQRLEQERIAAQRQAERERAAEQQRIAAEQARERAAQQWRQQLAQARSGLRLSATTCPGGDGRYFVTGPRAQVQGCVTLAYEARCPGTPRGSGVRGSQSNYVGGSCLGVGDAIEIPRSPLACPAGAVQVDVVDVTACE